MRIFRISSIGHRLAYGISLASLFPLSKAFIMCPNCVQKEVRFLQTGEASGLCPLSPTILVSTTCTIPRPGKITVVLKFAP